MEIALLLLHARLLLGGDRSSRVGWQLLWRTSSYKRPATWGRRSVARRPLIRRRQGRRIFDPTILLPRLRPSARRERLVLFLLLLAVGGAREALP